MDFAEHLTTGRLVEADLFAVSLLAVSDCFEHSHRAHCIDIGRKQRHVKTDANVRLRGEVVDFVGLNRIDDVSQAAGVSQVSVVQSQLDAALMRILKQVIDPARRDRRGSSHNSVNFVALLQQEFRKLTAVLASDSSNESGPSHGILAPCVSGSIHRIGRFSVASFAGSISLRLVVSRIR